VYGEVTATDTITIEINTDRYYQGQAGRRDYLQD
jgi:hypothetical protein